jgi:Xaa-Pro aminopeptidase
VETDAFGEARESMAAAGIDAWLVYDFRGSNPVMAQLLPHMPSTTRRSFLLVPVSGEPRLLTHVIEATQFGHLDMPVAVYDGREAMLSKLREFLGNRGRVAMEYSPRGELPTVSWVDGGTLELVRSLGVEVISSADLLQAALARWSGASLEAHLDASRQVTEVKDGAFDYIRSCLASAKQWCSEYDVQQFIVAEFRRRNLEVAHAPIVGVNANSADPHYSPTPDESLVISPGDWVLIDLWARHPGEGVFADITWVACAGTAASAAQRRIFEAVREARDLVLSETVDAFASGRPVQGWELDRVARDCFERQGMSDHVLHRTGHSLSPGPTVHGIGANLDDLEARDNRVILPGTGFTVEPGLYLPEFGVRLEVNVYVDPESGPQVTTPAQTEVILLDG